MQLTMPSEPATAVSTAINTLRMKTHPFPPSMEGDTESVKEFVVVIWLWVIGYGLSGLGVL